MGQAANACSNAYRGLRAAPIKGVVMWYFAWMLGIGFAVMLAILNAMWGENQEARQDTPGDKK